MRILFNQKIYRSVGSYFEGVWNNTNHKLKTPCVGDYLEISSLRKNADPNKYVCKSFPEAIRQIQRYQKAFGTNLWTVIKNLYSHSVITLPTEKLFDPILSVQRIAKLKIKTRGKGIADATVDKLDFGVNAACHEYCYVLKHNDKQIGFLSAVFIPNNSVEIEYLTNILGRKKYRHSEQILVQTLVEDCLKKGFIPEITACAVNAGKKMGRGYDNALLYKKMGMRVDASGSFCTVMSIDAKDVASMLKKYLARNGEILEGTKARFESFNK